MVENSTPFRRCAWPERARLRRFGLQFRHASAQAQLRWQRHVYSNRPSLISSSSVGDMVPTPRHHAAPLGLAGILVGFACHKHAAPTELAASVVPTGTWQPYGRRPRFETLGYCHLSPQTGARSLSAMVLPPQFLAVLDILVRMRGAVNPQADENVQIIQDANLKACRWISPARMAGLGISLS